MMRIFVSLLTVVFVSIFVINTASEFAWNKLQGDNDTLSVARQMVKVTKEKLSVGNHAEIDSYPIEHFAWLEDQRDRLIKGDIIELFSGEEVSFFFSNDGLRVYELGPYYVPAPDFQMKIVFNLVSYFALICFLLLWLKPLWKDLNQVKLISQKLSEGKLDIEYVPVHFSAIASHTHEIQKLTSKVAGLIENQRYLVNAVSHELRTPLARLKFALAMQNTTKDKHFSEVQNNILEIEALIDEMLKYARLEEVVLNEISTPVELKTLLSQTVSKVNQVDIKFTDNIEMEEVWIKGESTHLERLFSNLLSNAVKYGNGIVWLSLNQLPNGYEVIIEDNGDGIDEAQYDRAFEPFSRLVNHSPDKKGFGLGLAIVKRIADWHGATCSIGRSHLGGAQFTLSFPKPLVI
ncbi:sensor histidine kinase [Pseudoalteromonas xiamenensis]